MTGTFGEPFRREDLGVTQQRFLNEASVVELRNGNLALVFLHQPNPTIRYYDRAGTLLRETILSNVHLDRIATEAEKRLQELRESGCGGGRVTVFGVTHDPSSDMLWVTTATDDGIGAVRLLSNDGYQVGQLHLQDPDQLQPIVPTHLAFAGKYLFWSARGKVWRADVMDVRHRIGPLGRVFAWLGSNMSVDLAARQSACGPPQTLSPTCSYNCGNMSVTCQVPGTVGSGFILEGQHCLSPPQTPANFRGCEKSATWCRTVDYVRDTKVDRISCGKADVDQDGYDEESGDCHDGIWCANPGAWGSGGTYCDVGACEHSDDDCNGVEDTIQCSGSPIIIDVARNGFHLTSAQEGVNFDLNADGVMEHWSWTATGSDDSWLALDRNGNGAIENGTELFGNFTPQPPTGHRNGYLALAQFDETSAGGTADGTIDVRDEVFDRLLLWRDENHNGVSEPAELSTLRLAGITALSLDHRASPRVDGHGNRFAYTATVSGSVGRSSYDVFLVCDRAAIAAQKP